MCRRHDTEVSWPGSTAQYVYQIKSSEPWVMDIGVSGCCRRVAYHSLFVLPGFLLFFFCRFFVIISLLLLNDG